MIPFFSQWYPCVIGSRLRIQAMVKIPSWQLTNWWRVRDEVVRVAVYKTVSSVRIELSFYPNLLKSLYKVLRREIEDRSLVPAIYISHLKHIQRLEAPAISYHVTSIKLSEPDENQRQQQCPKHQPHPYHSSEPQKNKKHQQCMLQTLSSPLPSPIKIVLNIRWDGEVFWRGACAMQGPASPISLATSAARTGRWINKPKNWHTVWIQWAKGMGKTELLCPLPPSKSVILPLNSQGQGMTHWSKDNQITDDRVFAFNHNQDYKLSIASACICERFPLLVIKLVFLELTFRPAKACGVGKEPALVYNRAGCREVRIEFGPLEKSPPSLALRRCSRRRS